MPNILLTSFPPAARRHLLIGYWRYYKIGPEFVKIGNSVRYTREDLDMFVQRGAKDTTRQDHQPHPSV